ncbi:MAG TPA: GFA family protein [Caulobacteraceae bacterium]|nr:GFA family protein [Caulobacteraceae bacterium]
MADEIREGGCNCGAVRFRISKPPLTAYLCHCHLCQKRTGSPFAMNVVFPGDGLEVTAEAPFELARDLGGGLRSVSSLCGACDSRLWTRRTGAAVVNVRGGALDDAGDLRPVAQIWVSSGQPWAVQADMLSYDAQPSDFTPFIAAWRERSVSG